MAYRRAGTAKSALLRAACTKVESDRSGFSPTFCFLDCQTQITTLGRNTKTTRLQEPGRLPIVNP
jgi:hypothetical protein